MHSPPGDFGPPNVCAFATPDGDARAVALREANVRAVASRLAERGASGFARTYWPLIPCDADGNQRRTLSAVMPQRMAPEIPMNVGISQYLVPARLHCEFVMPGAPQNIALARLAPRDGDVTPGNRGGGGA